MTTSMLPIILWWTGRIHSSLYGDKGVTTIDCPTTKCLVTSDRSYFDDERTRIFIFYGSDIDLPDLPLPRKSNHEWALFHEESPMNKLVLLHKKFITLFNHTATFKKESHFPLTSQHIPSLEYLTERKPVPLETKKQYKIKNNMASVLYIQSHCPVASDRDRYVKKLMEYLPIDSYGKCNNNKNLPKSLENPVHSMHSNEFLSFISNYKFHLSFENAICKDYMTEKLFRALHVGSVPIYKGSPDAEKFMPDNQSVILVDDFKSPKELADFIIYLDENDEEYLKYLNYKTDGIMNQFLKSEIYDRPWSTTGVSHDYLETMDEKPDMFAAYQCYLCDEITIRLKYENNLPPNDNQVSLPPKIADKNHMSCPQPYTSVGYPEDCPSNDRWIQQGYIDEYWSSLDMAIAVDEMIKYNESNPAKFFSRWQKIANDNPRIRN